MFSDITNLTDLNARRAALCRERPRTEWAEINLEYTRAANAIRSAVKKTGRVSIPTITPTVMVASYNQEKPMEALYDSAAKCLIIYKMQDSVIKNIPTVAERTVKVNMNQSHIEVGVQL